MATYPFRLVALAGMALIGGCVAYPYQTAFQTCDSAAGACYRGCEDYAGTPEYGQCHADCEYSADRCFDSAYEPYRYSYGYPSTWRGRYGYWYPDSGYAFSFGYYSGYRDRYHHRRHHDYRDRRRDYRDDRRDRRRRTPGQPDSSSGGQAASPPPPVRNTPPVGSGREGPRRVLPRSTPPQPPRVNPAPAPSSPPATTQSSPSSSKASRPPKRGQPKRTQPRRETPRGEPDRDLD